MTDHDPHIAIEKALEDLQERLGPLFLELAPFFESGPDLTGDDWETKYAAWWAQLLARASTLVPNDKEIAEWAARWSSFAERGTIELLRKASALTGEHITPERIPDLLRNLLPRQ